MNKNLKKFVKYVFLVAIIALLAFILVMLTVSTITAKSDGQKTGTNIGNMVGSCIGSVDAISDADKFFESGVKEGLSAKDTKIKEIEQTIKAKKEISVLSASVTLDDILSIEKKAKYLLLIYGTIEFVVDLNNMEIRYDNKSDSLNVSIPEPKLVFTINNTETYDKTEKFNIRKSSEGAEAYENSIKKIKTNVRNELENYDSLMLVAKSTAKAKIKELVSSLSFADTVSVEFKGGV